MPIQQYLEDHSAFDQDEINAMSKALEDVCKALHVDGRVRDREVVAERIISLARSGVLDPKELSERVIAEVKAIRSL